MGAQLRVVEDVCAVRLSDEGVCLSASAFAALELAVPADFSRPGARPQVMLNSGAAFAAFTVTAVLRDGGSNEPQVALGDPDRLFGGWRAHRDSRGDDRPLHRCTADRDLSRCLATSPSLRRTAVPSSAAQPSRWRWLLPMSDCRSTRGSVPDGVRTRALGCTSRVMTSASSRSPGCVTCWSVSTPWPSRSTASPALRTRSPGRRWT